MRPVVNDEWGVEGVEGAEGVLGKVWREAVEVVREAVEEVELGKGWMEAGGARERFLVDEDLEVLEDGRSGSLFVFVFVVLVLVLPLVPVPTPSSIQS